MATLSITGLGHGLTARRHCAYTLVLGKGAANGDVGVSMTQSSAWSYACDSDRHFSPSASPLQTTEATRSHPDSQMPFTARICQGRVSTALSWEVQPQGSLRSPAEAA